MKTFKSPGNIGFRAKGVSASVKAAVAASLVAASGMASAAVPTIGELINSNVDVGSVSTTATTMMGSAIGIASLIAAARIGKRLVRTL